MEGLVNYSSEDEHEEYGYDKMADGSNRSAGRAGNRGRGSHKDESPEKYDRHSNSHRSSSSRQRDGYRERNESSRDARDSREVRNTRDARDSREFSHDHQRSDNRSTHDRNHERYGREEHNKRDRRDERSRNDERYNSRNSSTTTTNYSHNNSRDNRTRYSGSSGNGNGNGSNSFENSRSRHQRGNNERSDRNDRNDRSERNDRSDRYSSSSSSRFDRNRQQQSGGKHSSRNYRSRSRSKDRKSTPTSTLERLTPVNACEQESSPDRKTNNIRSYNMEQQKRPIAPLMSLPLGNCGPRQPNVVAITSNISGINPNNAESPAPITLPSYYNPNIINPTKYAEQVQKRKLLWGAKKAEDTTTKWGGAQFSQDTDGKVASKFMRLMGIKNSAAPATTTTIVEPKEKPTVARDVKSREAMFSSMEQQYEVARQVTHTMRGVGLGFGSSRPV